MANKIPQELLERYYAGKCTREERETVLAFLASDENEELVSDILEQHWKSLEDAPPASDETRRKLVYPNIENAIARPGKPAIGIVYRIAASVLLIASVSYLVWQYGEDTWYRLNPIGTMEVVTDAGYQQKVTLPDGSEVWMNAGSTLRYPEVFRSLREVELRGEAFFVVKKNPEKLFVIRTGKLFTSVLGTSFNVKAYADDENTSVTVSTGKVAVSLAEDSVFEHAEKLALLAPRQQLTVNKRNGRFSKSVVHPQDSRRWMEGELFFNQTSITEVASMLERWYGCRIEIVGVEENLNCSFTGNFRKGVSLNDALETLSLTGKINFTVRGDSVRIDVVPCYEDK